MTYKCSFSTTNPDYKYNWTIPSSYYATVIGDRTKRSITIEFKNYISVTSIQIRVSAGGEPTWLDVTVFPTVPNAAGGITGETTVCPYNQKEVYTVSKISNASSYEWRMGSGSYSVQSSKTNTQTVNFFAGWGESTNIMVMGVNACGKGQMSTLPINILLYESPNTPNIIGEKTVCPGQNNVNYTAVIKNATNYIWTLPSGATGTSSTENISVDFSNTAVNGNITVIGANNLCTGLAKSFSVTISSEPADAGLITGLENVCPGQDSVEYTVPTIENAIEYIWTLPNGVSDTNTSNSIIVNFDSSAVSGNISVKGLNACGVGKTSSLAIAIKPLPLLADTIIGPTSICHGQNSAYYEVSTVANAASYDWTLPNGVIGYSNTNRINVDIDSSFSSGVITVKGINSCGEGAITTLTITIDSVPINTGTITGSSKVCQKQDFVIYTAPSIPNAHSYVWSLPNGTIGTSTTNSISVNFGKTAVSGDITVKGINSCGESEISVLPITVSHAANAGIDTVICAGSSVSLTAIGGISFEWNNGISQSVPFTPDSTKTYIVTVSNIACDSIDSITVTVLESPQKPIISLVENYLQSTSTIGNQWYNDMGLIPGATGQKYTPNETDSRNYYVILTDSYGCISDTSNILNINFSSVNEISTHNSVKIFPNPVSNELIIEIEGNNKKLNFEILNTSGQSVFKGNLVDKTTVQTSNFAPGVYLIKLENGETFEFKKIIKE